jgi:hypothetical protein
MNLPPVPIGSPYIFTALTFNPFAVTAGQMLAILVIGFPSDIVWYASGGNSYAGGDAFTRWDNYCFGPVIPANIPCQNVWNPPMAGVDFGFRTFVEPAAVPEPASLALLGTGIAGLIARRARRRHNRSSGPNFGRYPVKGVPCQG